MSDASWDLRHSHRRAQQAPPPRTRLAPPMPSVGLKRKCRQLLRKIDVHRSGSAHDRDELSDGTTSAEDATNRQGKKRVPGQRRRRYLQHSEDFHRQSKTNMRSQPAPKITLNDTERHHQPAEQSDRCSPVFIHERHGEVLFAAQLASVSEVQ